MPVPQAESGAAGQEEAEARIARLAHEQQVILDTAWMGICLVRGRVFTWANPAFLRMFGIEPDQLQGTPGAYCYATPEEHERVAGEALETLTSGGVYATEARMKRRDGTPFWCQMRAQVISPGCLDEGAIWFLDDITEKREAEAALRAGDERLGRLLQHSNDIIAVVDANGVQTLVIGPVARSVGFTEEELAGTDVLDRVHPDDAPMARDLVALARARPGATARIEYRVRHKDGHWVSMEAEATSLLDDPLIRGTVLNVRDVTERKRAERERRRLHDQLQQAMKMEAIGRLAGGIAHDFNNLLTTVAGNIELAQMAVAPDDPIAENLREISEAAERATTLTRQLLAFSRRQVIEPRVIDMNDLVSSLQAMLARLLGEDVTLETVPADRLQAVRVDRGQFEQVLINLAVNARDAMPQGGKLVIETANVVLDEAFRARHPGATPGAAVLLAVSDTGGGMTDEVRQRIFEPFFTTKPAGLGTGLGLATAFGTVEQAGGTIDVYSEVGLGTTFKIYLPAVDEPAERPRARTASQAVGGTETVLVVEDERSVRELALALLQRLGYHALQASDAEEALALAGRCQGRIDLLLTDVVMPGMNGRELAERLVVSHPETQVLFTSGYTEDVMVRHGVVNSSINFIGKPYTLQELAAKLRQILAPGDTAQGRCPEERPGRSGS